MSNLPEVTIYTDGAAEPNPGPAGYGVVLLFGQHRKELSGGFQLSTNNRAEIMAALVGLRALTKPCKVTLYSDSKYLVDAMSLGWAERWKANGWKLNKKDQAKNPDLWRQLLEEAVKHEVEWCWVKGHAGDAENERCDELAVAALKLPGLPIDPGYEVEAPPTLWDMLEEAPPDLPETLGDETVMLTDEFIESGKSVRGGWNREQLACLGVSWPPPQGWKQRLVGQRVRRGVAERFLALRKADS